MGVAIGTCSHELFDITGNALTIKEHDREGNKCLCYVTVCDACAAEYEQDNIVLHNTKEENDYVYGEGTIEKIIEKMLSRGYGMLSYTAGNAIYFFGKTVASISINATVYVKEKGSTVELTYHGLKMCMYIATGHLSFDHPKFERFENIILHYASVCDSNNPFDIGL